MHKAIRSITLPFSLLSLSVCNSALAQDGDYSPPMTAWGVPDVQGIWNYENRTSLERPDIYEGELEIDEATMLEKMVSTPDYIVFLESTGAEAPGPDNVGGYNGFWISPGMALAEMNGRFRTSIIVEPTDGQIPWREDGQTIRRQQRSELEIMGMAESDGPEGRTLSDRCLKSFASTAPFLSSLYNNTVQIVQSPGHAVLLAEMAHDARIVKIDQAHKDLPYDKWLGDSIGYYEDNALVVVTKNFNQWQVAKERLVSPDLVLTERFYRVADDKIHYAFTIEDPALYTQPWTGEMPMYTAEGLYEYACHEGNYAMPAILAGARRQEVEAELAQD
ncbi:MAG: hypothetical protein MRY76_02910 [Pseudomonadales bacterium]|nr:hypothetical protein [Pseudomonadales bacterium]